MTDWLNYSRQAYSTAVYPPEYKTVYPLIGLMGELGELIVALERYQNKGGAGNQDIIKECGDCLWYVNALCRDLGIPGNFLSNIEHSAYCLHDIYLSYGESLATFENILLKSVGVLSERIKRHLRDKTPLNLNMREIAQTLSTILSNVFLIGILCGSDPEQIASTNLSKLASRARRGKIHGEGDAR